MLSPWTFNSIQLSFSEAKNYERRLGLRMSGLGTKCQVEILHIGLSSESVLKVPREVGHGEQNQPVCGSGERSTLRRRSWSQAAAHSAQAPAEVSTSDLHRASVTALESGLL